MNEQEQAQQMKKILKSFQRTFERYADEIASDYADDDTLRTLRKQLQRREPSITDTLIKVLGDGTLEERTTDGKIRYSISRRDLLGMILLEANTKNLEFFNDLVDFALREINRSLGNIENGLWPPKEKPPILIIKDAELRDRCAGLLSTSGKYDTVIREATTILENRIRSKAGHDLLARLIPNANDQTGENLVNQLFSPTKPILEVSSEKDKRISFHRILLGVVSYLRNPYHHKLDPSVEWSWAWSTVGLVLARSSVDPPLILKENAQYIKPGYERFTMSGSCDSVIPSGARNLGHLPRQASALDSSVVPMYRDSFGMTEWSGSLIL